MTIKLSQFVHNISELHCEYQCASCHHKQSLRIRRVPDYNHGYATATSTAWQHLKQRSLIQHLQQRSLIQGSLLDVLYQGPDTTSPATTPDTIPLATKPDTTSPATTPDTTAPITTPKTPLKNVYIFHIVYGITISFIIVTKYVQIDWFLYPNSWSHNFKFLVNNGSSLSIAQKSS